MNETYLPEYASYPAPVVCAGCPTGSTIFGTWMHNGIPVVVTPEVGVDMNNDNKLRRRLTAAAAYSPVVVVDGSAGGIALAGMRVLNDVGRTMTDNGGELRVVMGSSRTIHHLQVARCHRHVRTYLNIFEAVLAPALAGAVFEPEYQSRAA